MTSQSFRFALDPADKQWDSLCSHFGGRRFAHNWTVDRLRQHLECYVSHKRRAEAIPALGEGSGFGYDWRAMRVAPAYPDRYSLRKEWNAVKRWLCVNAETGERWWSTNSKEAYANGIFDACDAYDRWAKSRSTGGNVGFPRFKRRGRDADRYRITTGALRLDGRHHVAIPRIGRVRTCENTRKLARHLEKGPDRAKIRGATIRRRGTRIEIVLEVDIVRPQSRDQVADPDSTVGVDVGVRRLATVANDRGEVVAVHENPRALDRVLADIKAVSRRRSRCEKGSGRYNKHTATLSGLHARAANIRAHHLHQMTTCLAKSHGTIVVEGARWPALIAQRGLPGARTRRRNLHDASPGEIRRQLAYKTRWYGSELVVADGFYPSSKTCPGCGHVQDIGWATEWACAQCGKVHDRDEAAAVNLAVYPQQDLGTARCDCGCRRSPVGASVKRRPKAKPEPAADTAVGTGDEPKTATAFDAEGFTGSGDATGRVRRQGHAKRGAPEQRGTPETPRRGARTLVSTNT